MFGVKYGLFSLFLVVLCAASRGQAIASKDKSSMGEITPERIARLRELLGKLMPDKVPVSSEGMAGADKDTIAATESSMGAKADKVPQSDGADDRGHREDILKELIELAKQNEDKSQDKGSRQEIQIPEDVFHRYPRPLLPVASRRQLVLEEIERRLLSDVGLALELGFTLEDILQDLSQRELFADYQRAKLLQEQRSLYKAIRD